MIIVNVLDLQTKSSESNKKRCQPLDIFPSLVSLSRVKTFFNLRIGFFLLDYVLLMFYFQPFFSHCLFHFVYLSAHIHQTNW